jgi:hypothetical protein
LQYLRQLRIPDPEAVLDGAAQVDPTLREDELLVLFETMSRLLQAMPEDGADKEQLKARTRRFLEAAQVVARARKADSIYTVLRKLVATGWMQGRLNQDPTLQPILRELSQHYEELTGILERLKPKG